MTRSSLPKTLLATVSVVFLAFCTTSFSGAAQIALPAKKPAHYQWTNDHMQVGVGW